MVRTPPKTSTNLDSIGCEDIDEHSEQGINRIDHNFCILGGICASAHLMTSRMHDASRRVASAKIMIWIKGRRVKPPYVSFGELNR
jgi:hypothetical protein